MINKDDKIVTFQSYYDPMLAHIVFSRLEDNDIIPVLLLMIICFGQNHISTSF